MPVARLWRRQRTNFLRVAQLAIASMSVGLGLPADANAGKVEDVTFPTNVIPNTSNDRPVQVKAKLYLPDDPKFPISALVISPSSGGVVDIREAYYANELAKVGIAALVVDSFASRGVKSSVLDQSLLTSWQSGNDAVAGLRWLIADGRFKPDKIAVMGVSKGGQVAVDTALEVRRRWMRMMDVAFAAHIPISPSCNAINRSAQTTSAPIFFMLAELDDYTPAAHCVEHAERLRKAGNERVEVKIYKGAHHAWERLGSKPVFEPKGENYSGCRNWIEDDGRTVTFDGTPIPRGSEIAWAKKNCMKLGVHCCGGTEKLKREATNDLIAFLKKYGF
jgi:dienelactone hydrolase